MINFSEVYIKSDQPTVCPKCGSRTEILMDMAHTKAETEVHICLDPSCLNEFVVQYDAEFDNGSL